MQFRIIDCFIFYNELDLLTYRLNILDPVVDYFVIVESTHTFVGKEKKLYFIENQHKYEKFLDKIIFILVDDFPYKYPDINISSGDQWKNEGHQREYISKGIHRIPGLNDNDIITITDVDEIPDPTTLKKIKKGVIPISINSLQMGMYYYNLHTKYSASWNSATVLTYATYTSLNTSFWSIRGGRYPLIPNGGWHLSYFGDSSFIKNKISNFSHQEYNNSEYTDLQKIEDRVRNNKDVYSRTNTKLKRIEIKDNDYLPVDYNIYLTKYYDKIHPL
jgi:beta-1,4-mannosyl-glycoprotein beta-1,4-N-acetylglucosaminyltransferase